ncbi:MAG: hypothetical protein AB7T49_02935 [Oligoflexales bacterium]
MKLYLMSFYLLSSSPLFAKGLENRQVPLSRGIARPSVGTVLENENPAGLILNEDHLVFHASITSDDGHFNPFQANTAALYGTSNVGAAVGIRTSTEDVKDDFGFEGGGAFLFQNLSLGISGHKYSSSTEIVDLVFGFLANPFENFKWGGVFYNTDTYYYHFGFGLAYEFLDQFAIGLDVLDVRNQDRFELYPGVFATIKKYTLGMSYKITTQADSNIPPADRVSASVACQMGRNYDVQFIYNYIGKIYLGVSWGW